MTSLSKHESDHRIEDVNQENFWFRDHVIIYEEIPPVSIFRKKVHYINPFEVVLLLSLK